MKKQTINLLVLMLVLIVILGTYQTYRVHQRHKLEKAEAFFKAIFSAPTSAPSWRNDLPPTATDVHEWGWADGFLPDYGYMLKAHISQAEFQQFVTHLGLTPNSAGRIYSDDSLWLSWKADGRFTNNWWDASDSLDATFIDQTNDTWHFAKYENGFLYFKSLNH